VTQAVHSAQGEDRSSYQNVSPWTADSFGFVKATEATSWSDPTFPANWAALREEGKPRGAYHFFHPELDAQAQAEHFMSVVVENGLEPGDMLWADSEVSVGASGALEVGDAHGGHQPNVALSGALASADLVGPGTLTFLETVGKIARATLPSRHCPKGVYAPLSMLPLLAVCSDHHLWVAYWSGNAPASVAPWSHWTFWQWVSGGGAGGGGNAYNGTVEELNAWINSLKPVKPPTPKRGAFPTPKSEIEKAKPYIPNVGDEEGCPEGNPDRPTSIEAETES